MVDRVHEDSTLDDLTRSLMAMGADVLPDEGSETVPDQPAQKADDRTLAEHALGILCEKHKMPKEARAIIRTAAAEAGGLGPLTKTRPARRIAFIRNKALFRLWIEVSEPITLGTLARVFGFADHSGPRAAILAHANRSGLKPRNVDELRGGEKTRADYDAELLAFNFAPYLEQRTDVGVARQLGIDRQQVRKIKSGQTIATGAVLRVCRAINLDPLRLIIRDENVSCEHHGKQA